MNVGIQENPKKSEIPDDDEEEKRRQAAGQLSPRRVLEIPMLGSSDSDNNSSITGERTRSFGSSLSSSSHDDEKAEEAEESGDVEEELRGGGGGGGRRKSIFDQIRRKSAKSFPIVPLLGGRHDILRKSRRMLLGRRRSSEDNIGCGVDFPFSKPSWRNFSFEELAEATDNFSSDNLIGKGGHAEVYKGRLVDGQVVAVKRITKKDKNDEDRIGDFLSELGIIAHINHPNAAKLIGFGADGGLHLVLQYLPHGSLALILHSAKDTLEWKIRFKVAIGVAEGLHYLHCVCKRRIIHRDITASNILLTEDYEPQISDFGLAKWLPEKWGHHVVSPVEGTFGYMAPEYVMHGIVDEKIDIFAFGVLLLEIITDRRAVDSSRQSLVMWAKPLLEEKNIKEIADPRIGDAYDVVEMERCMFVASSCIQHQPDMRPNMKKVVEILKGEKELKVDMKRKSMGELFADALEIEDDYASPTYRKHMDRHMQLIME